MNQSKMCISVYAHKDNYQNAQIKEDNRILFCLKRFLHGVFESHTTLGDIFH